MNSRVLGAGGHCLCFRRGPCPVGKSIIMERGRRGGGGDKMGNRGFGNRISKKKYRGDERCHRCQFTRVTLGEHVLTG